MSNISRQEVELRINRLRDELMSRLGGAVAGSDADTLDGLDSTAFALAGAAPATHATSHQNGGTDEISVAGLSGLLADAQTPLTHAHAGEDITSGTVADARIASTIARDSEVTSAISTSEAGQVRDGDAAGGVLGGTYPNPSFAADMATQAELDDHSARHENGGADEISVAGLSGLLADAQTPLAHTHDHGSELTGLSDDDHAQYLALAGRAGVLNDFIMRTDAGVATITGSNQSGGTMRIQETSHATRGILYLGQGTSVSLNFATGDFVFNGGYNLYIPVIRDITGFLTGFNLGNGTIDFMISNVQNGRWNSTMLQLIGTQHLQLPEIAAPAQPASGFGAFYVKTDGLPYFKNDGGTEYDLTASVPGDFDSVITGSSSIGANKVRTIGGALTIADGGVLTIEDTGRLALV